MMDTWQPIETAPKDGTHIRLRFRDAFGYYDGHGEDSWSGTGWVAHTPHGLVKVKALATHWKPLLKTPKKTKKLEGRHTGAQKAPRAEDAP